MSLPIVVELNCSRGNWPPAIALPLDVTDIFLKFIKHAPHNREIWTMIRIKYNLNPSAKVITSNYRH